jgi:hypothetical protein
MEDKEMSNLQKTVTVEAGYDMIVGIKQPTNQQLKDADIQRAKVWNKAFKEGVMTKAEVDKVMRDRGLWDNSKAELEESLTKQILELEKRLYRGDGKSKPKLSDGRKIAIEMKNKRIQLRDLISDRLSLDENTVESLADNARFDYLVYACAYNVETEERIFSSYEDYNNRGASAEAVAAAQLLAQMVYNLDEDYEDQLPENKFLNKFNLINEEGLLVDPKTNNLIDINGKKINKSGHYLDDQNNRIDIDGDRLDSEGYYELVEYDNDLVDEPPKSEAKPKRIRRKTTKKTLEAETTD